MGSPDVVVLGAGVFGCAIARELAIRGASAAVIERGHPAQEATGAAAGMLTARAYATPGEPLAELCLEGARRYPALVEDLRFETGAAPHFARCGSIRFAAGPEDAAAIETLAARHEAAGWPVERVSGRRLAALAGPAAVVGEEPALAFPDEAIVDPRELVRGLRISAERRGVRFATDTAVTGLVIEGGECRGVRTAREDRPAGAVVDAAGAWAGLAAAGRLDVPIAPARGQIVELDAGNARPACMLHRDHFYLAPREHGRLLAGATVELAGYDRRVTASALAALLESAAGLVPALADARFVAAWAGLRPMAPDGLPILGGTPVPGYILAAGGFRNGVLMAPAVAPLVAAAALGSRDPAELAPFALARFLRERRRREIADAALQRETPLVRFANARKRKDLGNA